MIFVAKNGFQNISNLDKSSFCYRLVGLDLVCLLEVFLVELHVERLFVRPLLELFRDPAKKGWLNLLDLILQLHQKKTLLAMWDGRVEEVRKAKLKALVSL